MDNSTETSPSGRTDRGRHQAIGTVVKVLVKDTWQEGRILSVHMPVTKRGMAYTVQLLETQKTFLVEIGNVRFS
jgi:hypothetical protein